MFDTAVRQAPQSQLLAHLSPSRALGSVADSPLSPAAPDRLSDGTDTGDLGGMVGP